MKTNSLITWKKGRGRLIPIMGIFLLIAVATPVYSQVFQINVPMDGAQEVPASATAGTGIGIVTVNTTTGTIVATVNFSGLTSPTTAGHIHMGAAGINGPVILPLVGGLGVTGGTMVLPEAVLLPAQLASLTNNELYINIHTANNLGGEIRGQIFFTTAVQMAKDMKPLVQKNPE